MSTVGQSGTKDVSLSSILEAAEKLMQELTLAEDPKRRIFLARECQDLLDQAEQIKVARKCQHSGMVTQRVTSATTCGFASNLRLETTEAGRAFTTREKIILLEGSKLHGFVFPPWTAPPISSEFELRAEELPYSDKPELQLSGVQKAIFAGWKRPVEAFPLPCIQQPTLFPNSKLTMEGKGRIDLVQDVTADCSVVASLCAITARAERGHSKMISSVMYPYDHSSLEPQLSLNGKYIFRMYFNGCFRKIIIDDRLPTSHSAQTLHVIDRNNPGLLWPALIEKAYLKVRGGYDFPGSNSGTDIWVLTSWIPEQLFLQRDDNALGELWHRLFGAFTRGDVLITVGTGGVTQSEELGIGLISDHDYAILDMEETENQQIFLVKNPWSGGTIRKERKVDNEMTESRFDHVYARISKDERLEPGTFWMDLDQIALNFESMYLNWNPALFSFREDVHFKWDMPACRMNCGSFGSNPQFQVRSEHGGTIWLLLSRHFQDVDAWPHHQRTGLTSVSENEQGFTCLYVFENDGEKVFLSDGAYHRGVYVDSPNTLIKFELLPTKSYTIVISEQSLPRSKYSFTLSAFSFHPLSISEARERYNHWMRRQSAWTTSSSGGNASSVVYHLNPQFSVSIPVLSDISLLLEAFNPEFPVHVKLLWGNGKTLSAVRGRDIIGNSGDYRKGFAMADIRKVEPGTYTIICSTFERGQLGAFCLSMGATSDCTVKQIPHPGAGLFSLVIPPATFPPGGNRLIAPLVAQRITRISVEVPCRLDLPKSLGGSNSLLKLAIELDQGPYKKVLLSSSEGEFLDYGFGMRTHEIDIHPNMSSLKGLWIVLERLELLGLRTQEEVVIEIHSDAPVEVGAWRQRDE